MKPSALVILAAGVVLLGCGSSEDSQIAEAQAVAAAPLRDPASAQFRNVQVVNGVVCGEINGKNAFGAYEGFQRFIVQAGSVQLEGDDPTGEFMRRHAEVCLR